jgi:hypothetical protein
MKLKKIDLTAVKTFLFQKGERLGLVICAAVGLVLLGMGIMKAGGSSTTYVNDFRITREKKESLIRVTAIPDEGKEKKPATIPPVWAEVTSKIVLTPYINNPEQGDTKRQNPTILKCLDDEKRKEIQVDFLRVGIYACELDTVREKAHTHGGIDKAAPLGSGATAGAGGGPQMVKNVKGGNLVVVSAVFPMRSQLEEYRKALRFVALEELLANPDSIPQATGLNVFRCEVISEGKFTPWKPLYNYDPKIEKLEVAERIDKLYREAFIDAETPKLLGDHLPWSYGMMTPLPQLANAQDAPNPSPYPKLNLKDIKLVDAEDTEKAQPNKGLMPPKKGPGMPNMPGRKDGPGFGPGPDPGGNDVDVKMSWVPWKKLPQELYDKFSGKFGFFDPSGVLPDKDPQPGVNPPTGRPDKRPAVVAPLPKGPNDPAPAADKEKLQLFDAVVRFVDVEVEAGKTYVYSFQVRFANPNYKKHKDVAFQGLADVKELVSPFSYTPPITVPVDYFYYAVDQRPNMPLKDGSDTAPATSDPSVPYGKWTTTVQIHRWLKVTEEPERPVADWAIAERLLVRRGDPIGRHHVMVEVPVWNKAKETFEIGFLPQRVDLKKKVWKMSGGVPINFIRDTPPPLLVDFEGGWKKIGKTAAHDESAVDILVLTSEGKLAVRNSRADTDLDNLPAMERNARWENWLRTLEALRGGGGGPANGPGVMPRRGS